MEKRRRGRRKKKRRRRMMMRMMMRTVVRRRVTRRTNTLISKSQIRRSSRMEGKFARTRKIAMMPRSGKSFTVKHMRIL